MDDEINLLEYWRVIVKRRWLIIGLTILCAFSGLLFSLSQPQLYKASVSLIPVETDTGGLASALSSVPLFAKAVKGGSAEKLVPILESGVLAGQVLTTLDQKSVFPKLTGNKSLSTDNKKLAAISKLRKSVEVKITLKGLVYVSVLWPEPSSAALLANKYVAQLGKFLNARSLNVNFHVLDPAIAPTGKYSPKTMVNVVMGVMLGLFFGVFAVFFLDYLERISRS